MRRHRLLVCIAIASVGFAVACNAIIGLSGDYDVAAADGGGGVTPGVDARIPDSTIVPTPDGTAPPVDGSGPPDTGAPDACPADIELTIDASKVEGSTTVTHQSCAEGEWDLCWNFDGDSGPPKYGWNEVFQTADAGIELVGALNDPARELHTVVPSDSVTPSSAGLRWTDWGPDASVITPLSFPTNATITATFHFTVASANDVMLIGGWEVAGSVFGLMLYPTPCGGRPRVAPTVAPPQENSGGAFIDLNLTYLATITLTHLSDDTFRGSLAVGPQGLWDGGSGLPMGTFTSGSIPMGLQVGLFNGQTSVGPNEIFIDDVFVVTTTP